MNEWWSPADKPGSDLMVQWGGRDRIVQEAVKTICTVQLQSFCFAITEKMFNVNKQRNCSIPYSLSQHALLQLLSKLLQLL